MLTILTEMSPFVVLRNSLDVENIFSYYGNFIEMNSLNLLHVQKRITDRNGSFQFKLIYLEVFNIKDPKYYYV